MKRLAWTLAMVAPLILPPYAAAAVQKDDYDAALGHLRQAVAEGDLRRAQRVVDHLLATHGDKAELLVLRGRLLSWQTRYPESLESLRRAETLAPGAEVAAEIRKVETAQLAAQADRLVAAGEFMQAGALLSRGYTGGLDRYETGTRLAAVRNRQGRHREAALVYRSLMTEYPKDRDLPVFFAEASANRGDKEQALQVLEPLAARGEDPRVFALRGRILFQQGRLLEAREEFEKAKRLGGTPELSAERKAVEEAINFQHLNSLVADGSYELAQPLAQSMGTRGGYAREARLLSGKILLAQRSHDAALVHSRSLHDEYPSDPEVCALYAEALVGKGRGAEAEGVLAGVGGSGAERLKREREDLFYGARGNWLRLAGDVYHYSSGRGTESGVGLSASQRFAPVVSVASVSEVTRFDRTDPQIALDLYLPHAQEAGLSGGISLSVAPGSSFLPRYAAGGELGWAFRSVDVSAGYNHFGFREDPADVLSAGATWYLPRVPVTLTEKVYVTTQNGSALSLTTVAWQPSYRYGAFLAIGAGNAGERRVAREDLNRYDTWLVRAGGEFRFCTSYSVGAEGSFESRRSLYDRAGGVVYVRYWWH